MEKVCLLYVHMHCIKKMANCTRQGGPKTVKFERYVEAIQEKRQSKKNWPHLPRSGWASQVCARCGDAERMFSLPLAEFMDRKGYTEEAKYIYAVNGWRRAADERGLSSLQVNAVAFQPRGQQVSFHTSIILIM